MDAVKKRGRPRKPANEKPGEPKKRGRPKKNKPALEPPPAIPGLDDPPEIPGLDDLTDEEKTTIRQPGGIGEHLVLAVDVELTPEIPKVYIPRHVDSAISHDQGYKLVRLREALRQSGVKCTTSHGRIRTVESNVDVIRWLLDQLQIV